MISILEAAPGRPLFFLNGESSTYVAGVSADGFLCHIHWGGRVSPTPRAAESMLAEAIAFSPELRAVSGGKTGLDILRYEYPTSNTGDFRMPAVDVRHPDGSTGLRLKYTGHRTVQGKPLLAGLPAVYAAGPGEASSLEIDLLDEKSGLCVTLTYTVFKDRDVVARSARLFNRGAGTLVVTRALSASLDIADSNFDMIHLPGAWARERWVERHRLHSGAQLIGSRRGASSHQHNPFFCIASPDTSETKGEVRGVSLVYSGNHIGGAEVDQRFNTRLSAGIHPEGFSWTLEPGESFQTPEAVLAFSTDGLSGLSSQYHRLYRERLVRGPWRDRERPVLINNWEATYFDFHSDHLVEIARRAASVGIELFVLDDGWFGKRNDDASSLGDWETNTDKLPGGLPALAEKISALGLKFGLWFEPEMISPDSELYRAHPDWCLHIPGRERTEARNQLVLDFSRGELVDAIANRISAILRSAPISYVKWDMNRHLTEVGSSSLPAGRQGEVAHRHILGVYRLMDHLTREFPEVLFESCSGGGGRFDPGMLYYMPQTWTSDNTDAISRLKIQMGTSLVYPPCTMGAHVSDVPNHQVHRSTPMRTRGHVALAGQFGFELDLSKLGPQDLEETARLVRLAKETRHLLREGDFLRLADPFAGNLAAWMFVSPDRGEALVTAVLSLAEPNVAQPRLRLRGLDPNANYRLTGEPGHVWPGDWLMESGLTVPLSRDFESVLWHLVRE